MANCMKTLKSELFCLQMCKSRTTEPPFSHSLTVLVSHESLRGT
jgi:hypothetical protein